MSQQELKKKLMDLADSIVRVAENLDNPPPRGDSYNFMDGRGPVPAHKHPNGGGWVEDTAKVHQLSFVGPSARVSGKAEVGGGCSIENRAVIGGNAQIFGIVSVRNDVAVGGNARLQGTMVIGGSGMIDSTFKK